MVLVDNSKRPFSSFKLSKNVLSENFLEKEVNVIEKALNHFELVKEKIKEQINNEPGNNRIIVSCLMFDDFVEQFTEFSDSHQIDHKIEFIERCKSAINEKTMLSIDEWMKAIDDEINIADLSESEIALYANKKISIKFLSTCLFYHI